MTEKFQRDYPQIGKTETTLQSCANAVQWITNVEELCGKKSFLETILEREKGSISGQRVLDYIRGKVVYDKKL